jgi:tetratricopeptide (TPR) repeat protein
MMIFRLCLIIGLFLFGCTSKSRRENKEIDLPQGIKPNKEIIRLSDMLAKEPSAPVYYERAKVLLKEGVYQLALMDVQKAIGLDSTRPEYYITMADIYFTTNLTRKAKETLEKCLRVDKDNMEARMKLAELHLYVKQHKTSIKYLDEILKKDIHNPKAYFIKGMNFKEMEDTVRAISSFQTVIEQDPDYYQAYMQLGILYSLKGNDLALQYLNTALKLNPRSTEALYARAMYFQSKNDYGKALKDYDEIIRIDPQYRNAYYNKGYINALQKNYNQAIAEFTNAIRADSHYVEAYYMRGLCFRNINEKQKAINDFEASLKINPLYRLSKEQLSAIRN